MAFESLIESQTCSSTERLYYLEQYTTGDDVGYEEACTLLIKKFGDEYRVASVYESKALASPNKARGLHGPQQVCNLPIKLQECPGGKSICFEI